MAGLQFERFGFYQKENLFDYFWVTPETSHTVIIPPTVSVLYTNYETQLCQMF